MTTERQTTIIIRTKEKVRQKIKDQRREQRKQQLGRKKLDPRN